MSTEGPGPLQKVGYLLGRPLPESMREWVKEDLTGPGHVRRYFIRGLIPVIPLFIVFLLIPGTPYMKFGMIVLLLIPFVYFQVALSSVYRRHLLTNNGLDPSLAAKVKVQRADAVRDEYNQRHGR
ncbi:DUF5313 family protein [Gordonia hydrophobica]|uniref:DUF5313 family protein n=1 Tax=Gordonia hydrophobica TaxID=40516 RepID=A0ABZ2TWX5_9ACTN|nr:DUF5313 family protein [Gordonia hydrophobica]MBM7366194.1 putative membrane protein YdbT with pleckstrin-like domain [Gordonia hydrophobica]